MLWPLLTILLVVSLIALHFWWTARYRRAEMLARLQMDELQRAHQQAVAQFQTQQEALLNSMVEGLLILDQSGRIQLANRAFTSVFSLTADIRGKTLLEALRLHELAEVVDLLGPQRPVVGLEIKLSRPTERCLQVNGSGIFDGQNRRLGAILVFHDLTRLKQLETARQEFVANVSHELRTPLSLIKGYTETLLDGAKDNPEVASKFLATIDRNAERLKLLIEDLLTISELESGRIRLNLQRIDLQPFVGKVLGDLKTRAATRSVRLVNALPELAVRADAARIEQVLTNLVDNAIKYGRPEGCVTVSARTNEDGWVECSVADDGPGIPPEAIERVFERFFRVEKARSREQGGTGLGLSIVKHIVQSHQGRVWAASQIGHGATFFFTLPAAEG